MYVFLGVETPSAEALKGSFKFQNLRGDIADQIRTIRKSGLWVLGKFIVGLDSDDEIIFKRQMEVISRTAIPWAMPGFAGSANNRFVQQQDETGGTLD